MNFQDNENNLQELMNIFQVESEDILERIFENLIAFEANPTDKELSANLYRDLHSIKGAIRMVGFTNIQTIIHKIEDIFDRITNSNLVLDAEKFLIITKSLELVAKYLHESVENKREIIGEEFSPTVSTLEYICDIELLNENFINQDLPVVKNIQSSLDNEKELLLSNQEFINSGFNLIFEIIDSIIPEKESQEIIILKEEVSKINDLLKDTTLYEVKSSLQNTLIKLDFVMNATNSFTISEILELRNELSSAAAKFNTSCIESDISTSTFFDIAEKISMLQGGSIYAKEIKDEISLLKEDITETAIAEIVNMIIEILDFIIENSVQLEEQMIQTLKSGIEYCASPNESIDGDLIVQQLEIMKQLLELNFKKDLGLSEIKNLSTQTTISNRSSSSTEIKTLHVNAQKLDTLVNQLGELIITKIKTEKNLEKIDAIKNINENCQKDLLKTSNYLRYYNRKYLQSGNSEQYTTAFVKQVFALLSDITQNVSRTIYDLNSLYRSSK